MKYYKKDDQVYAFEDDGSQDDYITSDMVLMTAEEVDRHLNPQNYLTDEQKLQIKKDGNLQKAQSEYDIATLKIDALSQQIEDEDGDIKTLESTKSTWTDYRKSLRAYLKTDGSGDLPVSPQAT
jgi:predicted secreted protein